MICRKPLLIAAVLLIALAGFAQKKLTPRAMKVQERLAARYQKRALQSTRRPARALVPRRSISRGSSAGSAVLALTGSNPPSTQIGLLSAPRLNMGGLTWTDVVAADFNGDGKMDFATDVSPYDNGNWPDYLSVALGNGNGTFQAAKLTSIPRYADFLAAADLNHDGKADIVTVNENQVDVYLSNSDGTFTAGGTYSLSGADQSTGLALADTNNDGKLDILETDDYNQVFTLLGNGDGSFQAATSTSLPAQLNGYPTAIGDLNGDGKPDIVGYEESTGQLVVLIAGAGSYTKASYAIPNGDYASATLGDLNHDGKLDVAVSSGATDVVVYLNTGNGSLAAGVNYWAGIVAYACAIADFNGDGKNDLAAVDYASATVTVLLNQGAGTFTSPTFGYAVGGWPYLGPAVADFNADGKADLVVGDDESESAVYLQGHGDGSFRAALNYYPTDAGYEEGPYYGYATAAGDFNGDGRPDLVVATDIGMTVFIRKADGTYYPGVNYNTWYEFDYLAVGDFNSDGKLDVAASDPENNQVQVFLGKGDGTFNNPTGYTTVGGSSWGEPEGIVVRDFNGDNKPDLAVLNYGDVAVLLNSGSGFAAPANYPVGGDGYVLATGDITGDGRADLVASGGTADTIYVLRGNSNGSFQAAVESGVYTTVNGYPVYAPYGVAIGDFNGDGKADVALTYENYTGNTVARGGASLPDYGPSMQYVGVLTSKGDGTFNTVVPYPATTTTDPNVATADPTDIVAADFNQDGKLDLIYANTSYGTVAVMYGKSDGTFYDPLEFAAGAGVNGVVAADLNGDGSLDVAATGYYFGGVTVMENSGGNRLTVTSSGTPSASGQAVTFTATIAPSAHGATAVPSGSVTFKEGSTTLGAGTLTAGAATYTTSSLAAGSHAITANFPGDTNFVATSASMTQVVSAPDYTVGADHTSQTISAGQSAIFNITASGSFGATVNFSCVSGLARGASCSFNPASATPSGGAAATVLTVRTTGKSANQIVTSAGLRHTFWTGFGTIGMLGCVLLAGTRRRRARRVIFMTLALGLLSVAMLVGCGGGGGGGGNTTPKGTMNIQVNAVSGSTTKTLNLAVTVQ
jgi:hypothetical protein